MLEDVDGRSYVDLVMSWGALILGHAHPAVVEAVREAAARGTSYGACTEAEVELAEQVQRDMPSIERLRFVNSGTEATMSVIRVARGFTGRRKVVMFEGGYHGHADPFLAKAGSGLAAAGLPRSEGVPDAAVADTILAPYNHVEAIRSIFRRDGRDIAAVIVEPVAANMGVILPSQGFLETLREETERAGALLVFDEVVTGYRLGRGGAQGHFGVRPDLTCLGKIVGGGLPAAAFGGRADAMERLAPLGPVYQAGTLAGNPVAMAAGLATLRELQPSAYERLAELGERLASALKGAARAAGVELATTHAGSMVGLFLVDGEVRDLQGALRSDNEAYRRLFHAALKGGVYLPPSPLEALFVSLAHEGPAMQVAEHALAEAFRAAGRPDR
jgi:glutamate-1-semialdehyde 2,1-aminomutase